MTKKKLKVPPVTHRLLQIHDEVGGPPLVLDDQGLVFQLLQIHHEVGGPSFDHEPPKNFFNFYTYIMK